MTTAIPGFDGLETIHCSKNSLVLRGVRREDGRRVVIKTTADRHPSGSQIAGFARERRMAAKAQGDYVVCLLDAFDHDDAPVLVLEDFGGSSLDRLGPLPTLGDRLNVATRLARAVQAVHDRGVIHKDVNPSNVLWNSATATLKLIDFGIATDLRRELRSADPMRRLEGTIRYMAPEQTGRMNRGVDRRSDLYAMGATLHHLFAGRPPFEGDDPMEVVHAHLARPPKRLHEIDARIPRPLSDLVARLLEKAPERRYQTAGGVVVDLETCARELAAVGHVRPFELGRRDRSDVLEVPQKLYGRTHAVEALLSAFDRAAAGSREVVLVSGAPGVGKTSLVHEIVQPIAERRGELLEGKCDPLRLGGPYAALGDAFGRFLRWVLTQPAATVGLWRARLESALGTASAVLVEVLPEIEALLGPQAPLPAIAGAEAENRFDLAFRGLVEVVATRDHPIALFLDDLQWADMPTLRLLERILTNADGGNLLVIGAYRDGEVDRAHPLNLTLDSLRALGTAPSAIVLRGLDAFDVRTLLGETLGHGGEEVDALASVCSTKTGGNPFFLRRFLEALDGRGLAIWNATSQRWSFRLEQIEALPHTENVVAFLLDRLQALPLRTQVALRSAACIGGAFDVGFLSELTGVSPDALQIDLQPAVDEELVAPDADEARGMLEARAAQEEPSSIANGPLRYAFVHDRIRQAAYESMAVDDAVAAHDRLATLLARRAEDDGAAFFDAVNHANQAIPRRRAPAERCALARQNLEAGRRAMHAAAFAPASAYFEVGISLLPDDAWSAHYDLALGLHADAAECAYLEANWDRLASRILTVKQNARSLLDQIKALEIEMQGQMARGDLKGAVLVARRALADLGFPLPDDPGDAEVGAAVSRAMEVLASCPIDELERLPDVADPIVAAAQRILVRASAPAYYVEPALLPIIACELIVTSVQRGLSTATPFALAIYGIVLNSIGQMGAAFDYGSLAERLIARWPDRRLEARTRLVVNNHVCTWTVPLQDKLEALRDAYRIGRDTGDFEYAAICGQCFSTNAFTAGRELGTLLEEAERFGGFMRNYGQVAIQRLHDPLVQLVRAFVGQLDDPSRLDGPGFAEDEACAFALASGSASLAFVTLTDVLVARYHFTTAGEAHEIAERARPFEPGAASTYHLANFHTYAPLAASRCWDAAPSDERAELLGRIDASIAVLEVWAAAGPLNHRHRLLLVRAERARVTGDAEAAAALFLEALTAVRLTRYVNDEALIAELLGRFHLARGGVYRTIGRAFLDDAAFAYQRWGALRKVERLHDEFPRLLGATSTRAPSSPPGAVDTSSGLDIDAVAVVRAARSISAEIELGRLLTTLFHIITAAGGAQRGLLLLKRDDGWEVAVEGDAAGEPALTRRPVDGLDPTEYPVAVLRYVLRTGETVLIDDASERGTLLDGDPYARAHGTRSVLALPVRHRGEVTSLLFLSHGSVAGAFTRERIGLMNLLMSQAAVSIHNAQLFDDLEARVAERTDALEQALQQTRVQHQQLVASQQRLVVADRLAVLGQLVAGVAHELNTPLGAIGASSENLIASVDSILEGLVRVMARSTPEEQASVAFLVAATGSVAPMLSSRERRAAVRALAVDLTDHGIDEPARVADVLVNMGITAFATEQRAALASAQRAELLQGASDLASLRRGVANIHEAARRMSRMVFALKSYGIPGGREKRSQALLAPRLDNVLTLYGHRFRSGVDVVRDYEDDTLVEAVHDRLDQVWTNLVHNALQAMGPQGTLALRVRRSGDDHVVVTVGDTGPGVPEALRSRVFEPFFTTKGIGEGSGLGLTICKDIVDAHGGSITIEGSPGDARFVVRLPLRAPELAPRSESSA
jgi:predicted ATPase/signal transduction histidine kinase